MQILNMKKILFIFAAIFIVQQSRAQLNNTELGFSKKFDETLIVKGYSKYITTGYRYSSTKTDTFTYSTDIFRTTQGTEDSMKLGFYLAAYNYTYITGRTVGSHYTDSSVFIDQDLNSKVWEPHWRYSVKYNSNHLVASYYSEFHQTTGWDGQMDKLEIKRNSSGQYTGFIKSFLNTVTHKFNLSQESFRYYSNGVPSVDSTFDNTHTLVESAAFVYKGKDMVRINSFTPGSTVDSAYWLVENTANHKIRKFTQYYLDTVVKKVVPLRSVEYFADSTFTGIVSETAESGIKIYPNPMTNAASIYVPEQNENRFMTLKMFDVMGRVVKNIPLKNGNNTLDKGDLKCGLYYYTIISESGVNKKGSIVIQ